jgi:hypothetical protein
VLRRLGAYQEPIDFGFRHAVVSSLRARRPDTSVTYPPLEG